MVKPVTLRLEVDTDSDKATLDEVTRHLLRELKDIDVESAALAKEDVLENGAKAADAVTIGALIIVVLPTVLPQMISFLRDWAARASNRTVKIKRQEGDRSVEVEYNLKNVSEEEIKNMLNVLGGFVRDDE